MRILKVGPDHYVANSPAELERYACLLLHQRLTCGQVPETMQALARSVCADKDGNTAYALLQQLEDDIALIPAKVL